MRRSTLFAILLLPLFSGACSDQLSERTGMVAVHLTDAPFPFEMIEAAEFTIEGAEIHLMASNGDSGFHTIADSVMTLDVLELSNGVTKLLGEVELPVGTINQLRLLVTEAQLTLVDGRQFALDIPSGDSSGLKVFPEPDIDVAADDTVDVIVDIDVSRSISSIPAAPQHVDEISGFLFHPVLRAVVLSETGALAGSVRYDSDTPAVPDDDVPIAGTTVSMWRDGEVVTGTSTDENGEWMLIGLEPGQVLLRAEAAGHTPAETSVEVTAGTLANGHDFVLAASSESTASPPRH